MAHPGTGGRAQGEGGDREEGKLGWVHGKERGWWKGRGGGGGAPMGTRGGYWGGGGLGVGHVEKEALVTAPGGGSAGGWMGGRGNREVGWRGQG